MGIERQDLGQISENWVGVLWRERERDGGLDAQ